VLFGIVVIFVASNVPRIFLNFYEFFTIEKMKEDCYAIPTWVMIMTSVSVTLMVLNSSINFFIYCLVNQDFRVELQSQIRDKWMKLKSTKRRRNSVHATTEDVELKTMVTKSQETNVISTENSDKVFYV